MPEFRLPAMAMMTCQVLAKRKKRFVTDYMFIESTYEEGGLHEPPMEVVEISLSFCVLMSGVWICLHLVSGTRKSLSNRMDWNIAFA